MNTWPLHCKHHKMIILHVGQVGCRITSNKRHITYQGHAIRTYLQILAHLIASTVVQSQEAAYIHSMNYHIINQLRMYNIKLITCYITSSPLAICNLVETILLLFIRNIFRIQQIHTYHSLYIGLNPTGKNKKSSLFL